MVEEKIGGGEDVKIRWSPYYFQEEKSNFRQATCISECVCHAMEADSVRRLLDLLL